MRGRNGIRRALTFWRRSIQARVVVSTVVLSALVIVGVGWFLLQQTREGLLEQRVEAEAELASTLARLCDSLGQARDAVGRRAALVEEQVVGARAGDELATELRECSRAEAELQGELRLVSERVTTTEVASSQLRDRREEAEAEWGRILAKLEPEEEPKPARLDDEERERT